MGFRSSMHEVPYWPVQNSVSNSTTSPTSREDVSQNTSHFKSSLPQSPSIHRRPTSMSRLLLLLAPLVVATSLKAISYGETKSAQTLFSLPTSTNTDIFQHAETTHSPLPGDDTANNISSLLRSSLLAGLDSSEETNVVDEGSAGNKDGQLSTSDMLAKKNAPVQSFDRIEKRQQRSPNPMDAGTMQIDCLLAPDICKNAGYYQNCIRRAYGNNALVTCVNGPYDKDVTNHNRVQSGVTLQGATPCNGWPWAQRFWHPQTAGLGEPPFLQTDEWPMATFRNEDFDPTRADPQVSLRCMPRNENNAGSHAWTAFRRCQGPYDPIRQRTLGKNGQGNTPTVHGKAHASS